jgi:hypothetical protein
MYIVVWITLGLNNELCDLSFTHETLENARIHYNALIGMDEVYSVSLCAVIESTEFEPAQVS